MAIVRQVDHVLLLTDAPEPLLETLSGVLGLPVAVPFQLYGTFASGLVWAGNVMLEAIRIGPPVPSPERRARIFGIAFEPEPLDRAIAELEARGIAHGAPAPYPHDGELRRWTNVSIDSMVPHSLVFLCEYAHDVAASRAEMREKMRARDGGPLGIEALRTIEINATDIAAAIGRWDALLHPAIQREPGTWIIGEGPSVRVSPGARDMIASLTLDVRSLVATRPHLEHEGVASDERCGVLRIAPEAVQGLDLRFVEARR